MTETTPFGLLNVNKPLRQTSRWVVDRVQRIVRPAKAGHAGTLDPLATGVLLVCVGQATRLIEYLQQMPKSYRAEFLLGRTSRTEDIAGEVTELLEPPVPTKIQLEAAIRQFTGEIIQRPPIFSALKVAGRRAYKLARKGRDVKLAPRPVTIHKLELTEYDYPRMVLEINCGSGTYVRSLGRDLAVSLGTGAVMSALERTAIGGFTVANAIDVTTLSSKNIGEHVLSPRSAVEHLPTITLAADQAQHVARGQFLPCPPEFESAPTGGEFAALDDCGNLAAILRRRSDGQLGPALNFMS